MMPECPICKKELCSMERGGFVWVWCPSGSQRCEYRGSRIKGETLEQACERWLDDTNRGSGCRHRIGKDHGDKSSAIRLLAKARAKAASGRVSYAEEVPKCPRCNLRMFNGTCEDCIQPAEFYSRSGRPSCGTIHSEPPRDQSDRVQVKKRYVVSRPRKQAHA